MARRTFVRYIPEQLHYSFNKETLSKLEVYISVSKTYTITNEEIPKLKMKELFPSIWVHCCMVLYFLRNYQFK